MRALLAVMVARGYALGADVQVPPAADDGGSEGEVARLRVEVQGPANYWALAALGARRCLISNTYDAMAVDAWLRAGGFRGRCEAGLTDGGALLEEWTVWRA